MFGLSFVTEGWIETFLFVFMRFLGLIVVSPIFGRRNLPGLLRIGFCLLMSMIMMMLLPVPQNAVNANLFAFFFNVATEMVLGMLLGYISLVVFTIAIAAGQLIDMQIGFGLSSFFDPQFGMQIPLSGNFLNAILLLVFFTVNGHHMIIQMMFNSFELIKPGLVVFSPALFQTLLLYFNWFFILVIKVAFPIIAVSVITEFALGIIVKTMPQMNVFVVGIPLKLFLGLVVMILFLSAFVVFIEGAFDQMFVWQLKIIQGLMAQ
ncbi:MAG: flagellar biosynthetic protein FliR [Hyphomonadaceae bacterium]|nr:flagellar biosynthetic protein FliR [Clostridia bacterium]